MSIRALILLGFVCAVLARSQLPDDLDKFLEKLFETDECEAFVGDSSFVSVATRDCPPHQCDFPAEVCVRPAAKYQDPKANKCKRVPNECLTAANGGVPVGAKSATTTAAPVFTLPTLAPFTFPTLPAPGEETAAPTLFPPLTKPSPAPVNVRPRDICDMGPPSGRFCGFVQRFVYNKETFECDEFWFPGCSTDETNANLFRTRRECERIADLCVSVEEERALELAKVATQRPHRGRPRTRTVATRATEQPGLLGPWPGFSSTRRPHTTPFVPPPPPLGPQGPSQGAESGGGNLLGLVQQGLEAAQQLRQGGNAAIPQVAAKQAQTWLQQFGFDGFTNLFAGR